MSRYKHDHDVGRDLPPDGEYFSVCCGQHSLHEIHDDIGLCAGCREWTEFEFQGANDPEAVTV